MAALSTLGLVAGLGSMAAGAYNQFQGSKQAQRGYELQQQGAQLQAQAASIAAGISKEQAAASVVFAGQERDINQLAAQQSITASNASLAINQGIVQQQKNIESQKRQAMEVDARRQQLEIIRQQQRGRALALTTGVAQGGSGSLRGSALQGAYGQIGGQSGVNLLGVQQSLQTGRAIFDANASITDYNSQMATLQNEYNIQQANNQTAKSNLAFSYAESNAAFQTRFAENQTLASQGAGLIAQGGGLVGQGNSQMQLGSSLFNAGPSIFNMSSNFSQLSGSTFNFGGYFMGGGSPSGYGR